MQIDWHFSCPLDGFKSVSSMIGNVSGCYAVFSPSRECLYVGKSKRLKTRVAAHFIDQQDGTGVQWRLSGTSEWYFKHPFAPPGCVLKIWFSERYSEAEIILIKALKPTHNKHHK